MTTCIACIGSHDGAQDQENASMSPDPFPLQRVGSGNETSQIENLIALVDRIHTSLFLQTYPTVLEVKPS